MRRLHNKLETLTAREREVLALIGRGMSLPQIAHRLHRSRKTVESHRLSLGRKLDASNRVELARIAITAGLAPLTDASRSEEHRLADLRQEVVGQEAAWRAMREIDAALATKTGHHYLRQLLPRLCEALEVRCAVMSELNGPPNRRRRDLLACEHEQMIEWSRLPVASTPCEAVIQQGFARFDADLRQLFPENELLQQTEAQSYLGVRLSGAHNEPIGVLAIVHDQTIDDQRQPETILRICASRAAAELERARMDDKLLELSEHLERRVQQRTLQLQKLNQQLQASERKFRTLVETMNDGLAVIDADGLMTYVNPRFCEMLDRDREELLGHSPAEFVADANQAAWFNARDFERRQGIHDTYQIQFRRPDGSVFATRISPRSLYDEQGEYTGSFGVISDLTVDTPSASH